MAYIESHQTLLAHPKTKRLARLLNLPRVYVIGHLHALWYFATDYAQDGDLSHFDNPELADAAEWPGDPDHFVDALCASGFLDRDPHNSLLIHDWYDYAGKLIDRRKANAERMRNARAKHVQRTCDACAELTKQNGAELSKAELSEAEQNETRVRARDGDDVEMWITRISETLSGAAFVTDEPDEIRSAVTRSLELVPAFDARAGPLEAEKFVRYFARGKRILPDWYATWLAWIERTAAKQPKAAADEPYADKIKRWKTGHATN